MDKAINILISKLDYVDYILSDEGYQSGSEPRKNVAYVIKYLANKKSTANEPCKVCPHCGNTKLEYYGVETFCRNCKESW